jgi:hypothetical protein
MINKDYLPRFNRLEKMRARAIIRAVVVVSIIVLITSLTAGL